MVYFFYLIGFRFGVWLRRVKGYEAFKYFQVHGLLAPKQFILFDHLGNSIKHIQNITRKSIVLVSTSPAFVERSRSLEGSRSLSSGCGLDIVQSPVLDESLRVVSTVHPCRILGTATYQKIPEQDNDGHLSNRGDEDRGTFLDLRSEVLSLSAVVDEQKLRRGGSSPSHSKS